MPQNLPYILSALIPALINLAIIVYLVWYYPKGRITTLFSFFVLCLVLWQTEDTLLRICRTEEDAVFWDRMLCIGWLGFGPLLLRFVMHYTGLKITRSRITQLLIYGPVVLFYLFYISSAEPYRFLYSESWGYVIQIRPGTLDGIQRYWISVLVLLSVFLLLKHSYRHRHDKFRKSAMLWIGIGILVPALQGILTQVLFPLVMEYREIPVTSTFMTVFSFSTIIALKKFRMFNMAESLRSDIILENLNPIVLIISPERRIIYCNHFTAELLGINPSRTEHFQIRDLVPGGDEEFNHFTAEVLDPAFSGGKVANYSCQLRTADNRTIDVLVTSHRITNNGVFQGVFIIANDITDKLAALKELEEERMKKQKELTEAIVAAEENERQRIGRELHDNVNQILVTSLLYLNTIKNETGVPQPYFQDVMDMIQNAINEIRVLSHELMLPPENTRLTESLDNIFEVAQKSKALSVKPRWDDLNEEGINPELKQSVFRVVQEQFHNVVKYAHASTMEISLARKKGYLYLNISDDGVGFDTSQASEGIGLTNMKARAAKHQGKLKIVSSKGQGCRLMACFKV